MSGTRIASDFTYRSGSGQNIYQFTIYVDQAESIYVRDIESPNGLIIDSTTNVPQSVMADINTAIGQVEDLLEMTTTVNGTLTFAAEAEKSVVFTTPMTSTTYRVYFSPSDFVVARLSVKSKTGFTVQLNTTFTGEVSYDVFI